MLVDMMRLGTQFGLCRSERSIAEGGVNESETSGYIVAYDQDEIQFPVYVTIAIGLAFIAASFVVGTAILFALGLMTLGFAYYNYPLLETGRPRIGAGQYGIFVEGLGIIAWRAVGDIALVPTFSRGVQHSEMLITLDEPLERSLIADWRRRPVPRNLMRLPWSMAEDDVIKIPLDVMDHPANEIFVAFKRMMTFYRR